MSSRVAVMENDIKASPPQGGGRTSARSSLNNSVGVTKLMQQCTSMLREKMWNDTHSRPPPPALRYRDGNGARQPDNALEAMGPVLESVLGSLTQEYERRLMLKDQEIKSCTEQLKKAQELANSLEQQLSSGGGQAQIEYQMTDEAKQEMEQLRDLEVALREQVCHTNHICIKTAVYYALSRRIIDGSIAGLRIVRYSCTADGLLHVAAGNFMETCPYKHAATVVGVCDEIIVP